MWSLECFKCVDGTCVFAISVIVVMNINLQAYLIWHL